MEQSVITLIFADDEVPVGVRLAVPIYVMDDRTRRERLAQRLLSNRDVLKHVPVGIRPRVPKILDKAIAASTDCHTAAPAGVLLWPQRSESMPTNEVKGLTPTYPSPADRFPRKRR